MSLIVWLYWLVQVSFELCLLLGLSVGTGFPRRLALRFTQVPLVLGFLAGARKWNWAHTTVELLILLHSSSSRAKCGSFIDAFFFGFPWMDRKWMRLVEFQLPFCHFVLNIIRWDGFSARWKWCFCDISFDYIDWCFLRFFIFRCDGAVLVLSNFAVDIDLQLSEALLLLFEIQRWDYSAVYQISV